MIKKSAAFISVAVFFVITALLAGCSDSSNTEIEGTWIPTTAYLNGESVKYNELGIDEDAFGFTFETNGKFTATLADISYEGEYVFNDTSVDVELNGETKKLDYSNGTLTLTLDYSNNPAIFTFIKKQ